MSDRGMKGCCDVEDELHGPRSFVAFAVPGWKFNSIADIFKGRKKVVYAIDFDCDIGSVPQVSEGSVFPSKGSKPYAPRVMQMMHTGVFKVEGDDILKIETSDFTLKTKLSTLLKGDSVAEVSHFKLGDITVEVGYECD